MRNLFVAMGIGACLSMAQAANYPSVWHSLADGGTIELTAATDPANKTYPEGNKPYGLVYVEKNGTIKVTVPEDATQPILWTGFIATNGTVTLDLTDVAAKGKPFQMRGTMAAALMDKSGTVCRGNVVVKGLERLDVGSKAETLYYAAPNVAFQNADGETIDGAVTFFANTLLMEVPSTCPFTFTNNPTISVMQSEGLASFYEDSTLYVTNCYLRLAGDSVVREDVDICVSNACSLTTYYAYAPTNNIPLPPATTTTTFFWGLWGESKVHTIPNNIQLADRNSFLQTGLRTASLTGRISGPGYVKAWPPFDGPATAYTQFADLDGLEGAFEVAPSYSAGKSSYNTRRIVLHGTLPQNLKISGTNCVVEVDAKSEATTYTVNSLQGTAADAQLPKLTVGANVTIDVEKMSSGTLLVDGAGTINLQAMDTTAYLHATNATVVCGASVFSRTEEAWTPYTTYFTTANGILDLMTYPVDQGPVTVSDGAHVAAATEGTPATITLANGRVTLSGPGAGWDMTDTLALWVDPSDLSKLTQVEVMEGVPTTTGSRTGTKIEPVGLKTITAKGEDGVNHIYPFVESVAGVRAGVSYYLYNGRQYTGTAANPTNEYYSSVYMYMVTNPASTGGLSYLTGGSSLNRRLLFDDGTKEGKNNSVSIPSTWRSATLVFGSQDGGGSGLFSDSKKYLQRRKGTDMPILSNDTCEVWLNGVKVADPTKATFSGGWDIVTIRPKTGYQNSALNAIGYSATYTGTGSDGGGQRYGEILVHTQVPTEEQRIALESYLAKKWHVANYAVTPPTSRVTVEGTGTLAIENDVELSGTATNITVAGSGAVTATTRLAVPKFDAAFKGTIGFGFSPWAFTVCPTEGVVDDAIDVAPAKIRLTETTAVTMALRGKPADGDLRLVSCGGFEGETTWSRTGDERLSSAQLVVDEDGLVLHIANGGTLLLFR